MTTEQTEHQKRVEELRQKLKGLKKLDDKEKAKRVKKAQDNFRYAVQTYFSHHVTPKETSKFRNTIYKDISSLLKEFRKLAYDAYRGAAKTTLLGRLLPLWLIAIKREKKNSVILGATLSLAKESLELIKLELEENENLINDFDIRKGSKWTEEEIIFYSGDERFRIVCYGAGKKIRGANWLGNRPELIICDDLENDENVETKSQRDKLYKWFTKAILKLPARKSKTYTLLFVGTMLHHDSLLARIQKRADFYHDSFPLVLKFPDNLDNLDKYNITKDDVKGMVLDDNDIDPVSIILEYLEDKESFMSEYQNQPQSKEGASFSDYKTFDIMPLCDAYTVGIDPALGKSKGDYFGVTVLGRKDKQFYASTKLFKIKPTAMIDKLIRTYLTLLLYGRPIKIAIETVQFQEFFKDVLDEKGKEDGVFLPIVELHNTVNKELRIDGLAPHVNRGHILIDENSILMIDELDTYPKSSHDDGLDSLEMAWRIAKKPSFDYEKVNKQLDLKRRKEELLRKMMGQD